MRDINWEAVSAISTGLGALASFAAVLTALWLARNSHKPQLSIKAMIGLKFQPFGFEDRVVVEVANTGARAENISSVWFRARRGRARMLFEIAHEDLSAALPTRVEPGETATFLFRPMEFLRDIGRAKDFIRLRIFSVSLPRRIIVGAQTSTNFQITSSVSPILQALFDTGNPKLFITQHLTEDHPVYPHLNSGKSGVFSTTRVPL